jgi:predicted Holliday junction resolvase-like endonuclease
MAALGRRVHEFGGEWGDPKGPRRGQLYIAIKSACGVRRPAEKRATFREFCARCDYRCVRHAPTLRVTSNSISLVTSVDSEPEPRAGGLAARHTNITVDAADRRLALSTPVDYEISDGLRQSNTLLVSTYTLNAHGPSIMAITVTGMRSNKPVNMDIEQLRGWAAFMDRAVIVSLVVTVMAVTALATTTWLSFRISGSVRAQEHAAFERYKAEMGKHAVELEQKVSTARERAQELEQAAADANARAVQAARESAASREKAQSAEIDAEEVRKRVAELGKLVRAARERAPDATQAIGAETPQPKEEAASESGATRQEAQPSPTPPIVASLRKYADTKAAVYVLDEASDAAPVGATISGYLSDAGWAPQTWVWTGVGGILGVVVLIKDGSDAATNEAASAVLDALRSAGFNVAKGDWPADWRRFRGTLNGPQTPGPTEAPIRIVIGAKAR